MITNTNVMNALTSPVRNIKAKVEIYQDSTLVDTCYCEDRVIDFTVERVGEEGKFFGFGICQRLNLHLIDKERTMSLSTANSLKIYLNVSDEWVKPFPTFHISEVRRDENDNSLSVTAYDALYRNAGVTLADLGLVAPYTPENMVAAIATACGLDGYHLQRPNAAAINYNMSYLEGANFETTEVLREMMNDIAEFTATVYFIDYTDTLVFKGVSVDTLPDLDITKDDYITLQSRTNRRLGKLVHVTELGENVEITGAQAGTTVYLRDNAFLSNTEDANILLEYIFEAVYCLTINQFDCSWRGNYLTEIGDRIAMTTKDNGEVESFVFNDSITYDGSLTQTTSWSYTTDDTETAANPTNLGDAMKQTFARVDKVNKEIEILASQVEQIDPDTIAGQMAGIEIDVERIEQSVTNYQTVTNDSLSSLTERVSQTMTSEDVTILIQQEMIEGTMGVVTETGYTFDKNGLTISKSGSELSTQITEDGMTITRNNTTLLTANNMGVDATNLHATTYLIIGDTSRFEDYVDTDGKTRTGCFWIGR